VTVTPSGAAPIRLLTKAIDKIQQWLRCELTLFVDPV
jgi:hypothetical protein